MVRVGRRWLWLSLLVLSGHSLLAQPTNGAGQPDYQAMQRALMQVMEEGEQAVADIRRIEAALDTKKARLMELVKARDDLQFMLTPPDTDDWRSALTRQPDLANGPKPMAPLPIAEQMLLSEEQQLEQCHLWISYGGPLLEKIRDHFYNYSPVRHPDLEPYGSERQLCRATIEAMETEIEDITWQRQRTGGSAMDVTTDRLNQVEPRFPEHGTAEWTATCGQWTVDALSDCKAGEMAFCVHSPQQSEGLSEWVSQIVHAGQCVAEHRQAMAATGQLGAPSLCVRWDGFNLSRALLPQPSGVDWRFPTDAATEQERQPNCISTHPPHDGVAEAREKRRAKLFEWVIDASGSIVKRKRNFKAGKPTPVDVDVEDDGGFLGWPFRNAYSDETGRTAEWAMPACIVSSVLRPSNALGDEFSRTLKELRNPKTLSIALYLRTGATEDNHRQGQNSTDIPPAIPGPNTNHTIRRRFTYTSVILCALQLEQRWGAGYDNVVWFVSTDQKDLGTAITDKFDESSKNGSGRVVLTTKNEGLHSAPKFKKQMGEDLYGDGVTAAFKDWWLLSEADLGVFTPRAEGTTHGGSFARSAFARTARTRSVFEPSSFAAVDEHGNIVTRDCGDPEAASPIWAARWPKSKAEKAASAKRNSTSPNPSLVGGSQLNTSPQKKKKKKTTKKTTTKKLEDYP